MAQEEQTYFLFGKYSPAALKGISSARTKRASKLLSAPRSGVKRRGDIHRCICPGLS